MYGVMVSQTAFGNPNIFAESKQIGLLRKINVNFLCNFRLLVFANLTVQILYWIDRASLTTMVKKKAN
jgi:hypothetical protein